MPGDLQRLDQRIGQPLRQLVERHDAVGRGRRCGPRDGGRRRRAAMPSSDQPGRPDRRQRLEQRRENVGGGDAPSSAGAQQIVDQMAGPRRRAPNRSGRSPSACPSRRSSAPRRSTPTSGLSGVDLKCTRQRVGVERCQADAVDAQGLRRDRTRRRRRGTCRCWRPQAPPSARSTARSRARDSATRSPAPASSRTLTVARSIAARARSIAVASPSASRSCAPAVDAAGAKNAASGCDRGSSGRDRLARVTSAT